nr:MAG TPA: anaerobic ribonucleoside triphosphate reductase [Caudoviricetes sp.]
MCRAYLSPWQDPETGEYITIGRNNAGGQTRLGLQ